MRVAALYDIHGNLPALEAVLAEPDVAAAVAGVPAFEYPPASVKQAVCGYGRADKAQVQRMVQAILRLPAPPSPSHAADALAVAICHALAPPLLQVAG